MTPKGTIAAHPVHSHLQRTRQIAPDIVAGLFALSGVVHLVHPEPFLSIMPVMLPEASHLPLVYASGVAELVCAAGLLMRRGWAGPTSAALLVAVLPSNVQFALDATATGGWRSPAAIAGWLRLPLQLPMIWAVLQASPRDPTT